MTLVTIIVWSLWACDQCGGRARVLWWGVDIDWCQSHEARDWREHPWPLIGQWHHNTGLWLAEPEPSVHVTIITDRGGGGGSVFVSLTYSCLLTSLIISHEKLWEWTLYKTNPSFTHITCIVIQYFSYFPNPSSRFRNPFLSPRLQESDICWNMFYLWLPALRWC